MNSDLDLEVYKAWDVFINKGIIPEGTVRAEISRSWYRCRGMDWEARHRQQLPNRMLQARLAQNVKLLSLTRPVMQEISEIEGQDFVALADANGYIVDVIGDVKSQKLLGFRFSEQDIGTNAVGTALIDDKALVVKGPEHYCRYYHSFYGAGVPLHNLDGTVIGLLAVYSFSQPLPAGILTTLKLGVRTIENQILYKSEQSDIIHIYHNTCSSIIDFFQDGIFVVDAHDNIINVNQSGLKILGLNDRESLIGEFLGNILYGDSSVLGQLLSDDPNKFISKFSLRGAEDIVQCTLVRRRITKNNDGSQQTILGFVAAGQNTASPSQQSSESYGNETSSFSSLIGQSEKWSEIKKLARRAAHVSTSVLIEGESGTGKEVLAHAIHDESGLKGPFIAINCGAIPKELLQSELFGYEEGSFTGARKGGGIGKLEMGEGGTVFLDEIGEMPFEMQVNLLRFLQDKIITPVGSSKSKKVDVRIIAATNRKLKNEVRLGRFREDLYYRLNVINIELPPLRERKLDIPLITRFFIKTLCQQLKRDVLSISDDAMNLLCSYSWPGNVRELRNIIENAIVFTDSDFISENILPAYLRESNSLGADPSYNPMYTQAAVTPNENKLTIGEARKINQRLSADAERDQILHLLDQFDGNVSEVARKMGVSRNTVYRKMKTYRIEA